MRRHGLPVGIGIVPITFTKCVEFNDADTDDYVTLGNVLNYTADDAFSQELWIKTSSSADSWFIGKLDATGTGVGQALLLLSSPVGLLEFQITGDAGGSIIVRSAATVNTGAWVHVVVTYDGSRTAAGVALYIDGVDSTGATMSDTLGAGESIATLSPFLLASFEGTVYGLGGRLDEVAVYGKALSPAEVTAAYNGGSPVDKRTLSTWADCDLWLRMGDGDTHPTLTDWTTNGYDGTMTNMAAGDIVTDSP